MIGRVDQIENPSIVWGFHNLYHREFSFVSVRNSICLAQAHTALELEIYDGITGVAPEIQPCFYSCVGELVKLNCKVITEAIVG